MGGIIRYENLLAGALWHSASPKKAPDAPNWGQGPATPTEILVACRIPCAPRRDPGDPVHDEMTCLRMRRGFVLAAAGYADGTEWGVSQSRMKATE
jgi:hypothetical protein